MFLLDKLVLDLESKLGFFSENISEYLHLLQYHSNDKIVT